MKKWLIIILLLAGLVAAVKLDFLGLSSKYLVKSLEKIPGLSWFLPTQTKKDSMDNLNKDVILKKYYEKEKELMDLKKNSEQITQQLQLSQEKIQKLENYEKQFDELEKREEALDEAVAKNDSKAFVQFYEEMDPDTAKKIYIELKQEQVQDEKIKQLSSVYSNMEPNQAAEILSSMIKKDLNLVLAILRGMKSENVSAILADMESQDAALITKEISGQQ